MCAQSCPTLCNPMDCSPPGSSVHGIFQARILEWVAMPPPGDLPDQGSNPHLLHLLHWKVGSLPLASPGKPRMNGGSHATPVILSELLLKAEIQRSGRWRREKETWEGGKSIKETGSIFLYTTHPHVSFHLLIILKGRSNCFLSIDRRFGVWLSQNRKQSLC